MYTREQERQLQKQLKNLLKTSVAKTIKKIKRPFGLFLSGGIDSGLLASMAKPDIVLTARFPYGEKYDEFPSAEMTAKYLGLKQEVIEVKENDFFNYLPNALKMYKQTTHFSLVPLFMLFKKASELGLKDILSAEGPDEYLGGYTSYIFLMNDQKLYEQPELSNYKSAIDKYLGLLIERFAKIIGRKVEDITPFWDKYQNLLSKIGYSDLNLRGIEEMEMAIAKGWGINIHYPFMSQEIEEFCFKEVPDDLKIKGFTTKYLERKVAEKYLPKEVVWRKNKMGGPVAPVGLWLKEENEFSKDKYLKLQEDVIRNNYSI